MAINFEPFEEFIIMQGRLKRYILLPSTPWGHSRTNYYDKGSKTKWSCWWKSQPYLLLNMSKKDIGMFPPLSAWFIFMLARMYNLIYNNLYIPLKDKTISQIAMIFKTMDYFFDVSLKGHGRNFWSMFSRFQY